MTKRRLSFEAEILTAKKFSLVIPTYNEKSNIAEVIRRASQTLDINIPGDYEIIVVDDDSPDRTWEVAEALTEKYPFLRVIRRQDERGLATAVVRGWQAAVGEYAGVIDGDLQHPPEILSRLLAVLDGGADIAIASRNAKEGGCSDWSMCRRAVSRGAQVLGLIILPEVFLKVTDPLSGFFIVRKVAISGCALKPVGYKILIEVLARAHLGRAAEVGYVFQERKKGGSKIDLGICAEYLAHLLKLRLSLWSESCVKIMRKGKDVQK